MVLDGSNSPSSLVLRGRDRVVSFPGTSQFRVQGVSACGLAALNFARIAFRIVKDCCDVLSVLDMIASRETVEEVISICARWSSDLHLEVDDISQVPLFLSTLTQESTFYGPPSLKHFKRVLQGMREIQGHAAVIITRPPEIIACFKVADISSGRNVFVIFDSHPRPSHPHGAGLVFSSSLDQTAKTLSSVLHVDKDLLSSPDLQWEAQLLTNCSAHVFVAKSRTYDAEQAILDSTVAILALRSEINVLKLQNNEVKFQSRRLEEEATVLQKAIQQARLNRKTEKPGRRPADENAIAGPSRLPFIHRVPWYTGARSIFANNAAPVPATTPKPDIHELEDDLAMMHVDFIEKESQKISQALSAALQLQKKYDAEDAQLRRQYAELSSCMQTTFKCGICLEEIPEDNAARIDGCCHMTCRSCMKDFISGKIAEHRFPINCPICIADCRDPPAEISGFLVEQMGITEDEHAIWTEMELSLFSILLHCRGCNRTAFVDREDYNELPNIVCPMGDCNHVWCKSCHRTIEIDGPKHSCDGSTELHHLMEQQGWKYCPNCRIPIQKDHGCNHMTCITPGCNTHFCYICGELIVRSALRDEIGREISTHFSKCQLFEVPD